ncbi:MAG: ABC transporter permease [Clostridiales bacterium]|jgi:rhamnose transport system permease protein|nr:ABC transporter permease [Clostridiales bacterium]
MHRAKRFFLRWEWLLVLLILGVFAFFSWKMPGSYTFPKLLDQTRVYMVDVGFMALGAMLILILGDIDISVASTAALSVTAMSVAYSAGSGMPFGAALALALAVGILCGWINGYLVTRFKELFPMIITLSTQTIYRGIAYIILKDQSAGSFPQWFAKGLGYGKIGSVPVMLLCVLVMFPVFYVWLHRTASGRRIFATGTNIVTARYSGLRTDRTKVILFTLNGLLAAVGGIFLASRTGSVKYTIGTGYEMQAIGIAVLGGASTAGGKGSVVGVLLSLVLMTCLKNGLMIAYNDSFILNLSIGVLLISVVLFPNIANMIQKRRQLRKRRVESAANL